MGMPDGRGVGVIRLSQADAQELLFREAHLLDAQDFAGWLDMYSEDAFFWMPAWRDDNTPTQDPDRELSLIYYRGKDNLRDRVQRLTSGLSPASKTLPRVVHLVSNVRLVDGSEDRATVQSSFVAHAYSPRSDQVTSHFGHYEHDFGWADDRWLICRKVIWLANDLIPTVLDVNAV